MGFQQCPGIAQFEMVYGLDGEIVENVFHVKSGTAWTAARLESVFTALRGWEADEGSEQRSSLSSLTAVIGTDLSTEDGVRIRQSVSPVIAGTSGSPALPNHCTIAVKAETGLRGRSNRGRTFWIGLVDAQVVGNFLIGGSATLILAAMNNLITVVNEVSDCQLVVLSRRHNGAARPTGVGVPITSYSFVDLAVDSQRRRLPFHNRHH